MTGLILAGGQSRRMGQLKAHLVWGDTTLLAHVIETLRPLMDEIIVVVKDARQFRGLKTRIVEDLVQDAHALGGLYTGLEVASTERCFACGCDAPFLNPRLIRALFEQADGFELVIPEITQGLQPLHAIYAKSALGAIEEQLRNRQWDLRALVPNVHAHIVGPKTIHQFDPEELSFFNINTPDDLKRALLIQPRLSESGEGGGGYANRLGAST